MNTTLVIVIILLALLLVAWLPIAIRTLRRAFHSEAPDNKQSTKQYNNEEEAL
jgi:predicted Holliday junction resolvase-like endonuclease